MHANASVAHAADMKACNCKVLLDQGAGRWHGKATCKFEMHSRLQLETEFGHAMLIAKAWHQQLIQ